MESTGGWENWFKHVGSDWDNVILSQIRSSEYSARAGRSLGEIAREAGKDPWDVFFTIVASGRKCAAAQHVRSQRDQGAAV